MFGKLRDFIYNLAVTLIEVGKPNDGVTQPLFSSGTEIDKSWSELYQEFEDAREMWRLNPMARRVIGLITAYVVGPGMTASSEDEALDEFISEFWHHPRNHLEQRLEEWSDELARSGELFIILFPNSVSGMCQVRAIPASRIRRVVWRKGDYEMELAYNEMTHLRDEDGAGDIDTIEGTWWLSPDGWRALYGGDGMDAAKGEWTKAGADYADGKEAPWMLHYAVNRPVGAVRGEGDLAPMMSWLRRYRRWLEDRVRLNTAVRSYLWIIKAPTRLYDKLVKKYAGKAPPAPGSMVVAHQDETWEAVAPSLQARDAEADGRAIRRMIAAGGPGTSLVDFGDSDDSNLATAKATAELRRRFLTRRQGAFAWLLADLTAHAFNRHNEMTGSDHEEVTVRDVTIARPDISVEDNASIAKAASDLGDAIKKLIGIVGDSQAVRRYGMRLFVRYVEEAPSEDELKEMLEQGVLPADGGQEPGDEPEEEESEMAARADDCGCKGARAALQEEGHEAEEQALAAAFGATLATILQGWGEYAAEAIGSGQFQAWAERVRDAGGDAAVVAAAVHAAAMQLDEALTLRGQYSDLLQNILNEYRALYGVPADARPLTDSAWIEERAAELKLQAGAVDGIMRGLREGDERDGSWAYLIAAGRFLQVATRTETMAAWAVDGEARNRAQLDYLASGDERAAWVEDCVNGCADDDMVCRARAGVIMPMALARMQRLAHPKCTLRFRRTNLRPGA